MRDLDLKDQITLSLIKWNRFWLLALLFVVACQSETKTEKNYFITKTGTRFHLENCRYLKHSRQVISIELAQKRGYSPCKVCKPLGEHNDHVNTTHQQPIRAISETPLEHAIRCSAKNLNGIQCKRMTRNPGGKCWQHKD